MRYFIFDGAPFSAVDLPLLTVPNRSTATTIVPSARVDSQSSQSAGSTKHVPARSPVVGEKKGPLTAALKPPHYGSCSILMGNNDIITCILEVGDRTHTTTASAEQRSHSKPDTRNATEGAKHDIQDTHISTTTSVVDNKEPPKQQGIVSTTESAPTEQAVIEIHPSTADLTPCGS